MAYDKRMFRKFLIAFAIASPVFVLEGKLPGEWRFAVFFTIVATVLWSIDIARNLFDRLKIAQVRTQSTGLEYSLLRKVRWSPSLTKFKNSAFLCTAVLSLLFAAPVFLFPEGDTWRHRAALFLLAIVVAYWCCGKLRELKKPKTGL